jgi:hypothetical protein
LEQIFPSTVLISLPGCEKIKLSQFISSMSEYIDDAMIGLDLKMFKEFINIALEEVKSMLDKDTF